MKYLFIIMLVLFSGCIDPANKNEDSTTPIQPSTPIIPSNDTTVTLFLHGYVLNATISDAHNQVATFDPQSGKYFFTDAIAYPVEVSFDEESFIDVDGDFKKTAADIKVPSYFQSHPLKSFCSQINPLTSLYFTPTYSDANVTTQQYIDEVKQRFDADICQDPLINQANAIVEFAAFNYILENTLTSLDDIEQEVAKVEDFFLHDLKNITEKIKYYSAYNTLVLLDKHKVKRVDTIHKPPISNVLHEENITKNSYSNIDVRDIYVNDKYVYTASGHDEFAYLPKDFSNRTFLGNGELDSFGFDLYHQDYNNSSCLFLANSKSGFSSFTLNTSDVELSSNITGYQKQDSLKPFSDVGVISISGYASIGETKRFLGVATLDKGFYLINAKNIFDGCKLNKDINESDVLINQGSGVAISAAFREDGSYVYVANEKQGLTRYKLTAPTVAEVGDSKTPFSLNNNAYAYKVRFYPNSNELLVTTQEGLQIYDVANNDDVSYVSEYQLEGSQEGYYSDIDLVDDFVIVADGTYGVKVLRLDSSYIPQLCGVAYFANPNDNASLAKVTSVFYNQGDLYVGLESYGVEKIDFSKLLFYHCR